MKYDPFYEKIELTEEEVKDAIYEAKKSKFFREKHKNYWLSKERKPKEKAHKTVA